MTAPFLPPWQRPVTGPSAGLAARISGLVPEVQTGRLRLRAPRLEDHHLYARFPLHALFGKDRAAPGQMRDALDGWLDFCQLVAGWALRGYGPWTIEPRDGGGPVGVVLINHEFGHAEPEIGWALSPAAEGRGYVSEAARGALDHAFGPMGFATLVSYIDADNARSIAVAERLGACRDRAAEAAMGADTLVYRHSPESRS